MSTNLSYTRRDIYASASASPQCLVVYPQSKKIKQRVGVGDSTGVFTVFSIGKRLEQEVVFTTDAASPTGVRRPVTCATLFADQLFFMRGNFLEAYSRKGKHFFSVDTNATEKIHSVSIDTPFIFISGDFMTTAMQETKELGFYMSPDRVHAMVTFPTHDGAKKETKSLEDYIVCLGCNDRCLRLVQSNQLLDERSCEAPVTALYRHARDKEHYILYGTQVGSIGIYAVLANNTLRRCGSYTAPADRQASIVSLSTSDADADGRWEVLVGLEDGGVQVMRVTARPDDALALELAWSTNVGEKVVSIVGGIVTDSNSRPDVLAHLFSGRVVAFTLDQEKPKKQEGPAGPSQLEILAAKREETQHEIAMLRQRIDATAVQLAKATGAYKMRKGLFAVASLFKASVSLRPVENKPLLLLSINADVALYAAVLRSAVDTKFSNAGSTVVLHSEILPGVHTSTKSLALARPVQDGAVAEGSKRLEVHVWADEGQADQFSVTLYAMPRPRTAQVHRVPLWALPLYTRVASVQQLMTPEEAPYVLSQVSYAGAFGPGEVQMWMEQLVPGMETRHQVTPVMYFTSAYLATVIIVEYTEAAEDGSTLAQLAFTSDSLTALAAIRRTVTISAGERRLELREKENILYGSAARRLRRLQPVMEACSSASQDDILLAGLRELQTAETDLSYLPDHLRELLENPDRRVTSVEDEQEHMRYIQRAVVRLYESLVSFCHHAPPLTPPLREELERVSCGNSFCYQRLEAIFFPNREHVREQDRLQTELAQKMAGGAPQQTQQLLAQEDVGAVAAAAAAARAENNATPVPEERELDTPPSGVIVSSASDEGQEL